MNASFTRRGLLGLAAATAAVLSGCSPDDGSGSEVEALQVFASTIVWASIARAVGGDGVQVATPITSPDQDPHDYEATAQDKLAMTRARLAVLNGGGYDAWASRLVSSVENPPRVVDAFVLSGLPQDANEHVFYDLDVVIAVANKLADEFGSIDAAKAASYRTNAATFVDELEALRTRAKDWAAAHGGAKVVSTESVAEYLLEDLGLTDVTPKDFIRQSESEAGPSVAVIESTRQLIGSQAQVLVVNGQTEDAVSRRLVERAEQTRAKVVKVYETFPEGVTDYQTFIGNAVDALTN